MKTTHTPGPWACTYTSNHAHDYRLTKPNGSPLPVNAPSNDRSEQRANADLIASAPDLLAALEQIAGVCASLGSMQSVGFIAREAIARATGAA